MTSVRRIVAAVVVLLAAGCSAASAGSDAPRPSAMTPSARTRASATDEATARPSATDPSSAPATPSPSEAPSVELGYGAALMVGNSVDLRGAPSIDAEPVGRVQAGERVVIDYQAPGPDGIGPVFGPVEDGGDTWYPVIPESPLEPPHTIGWLAIAFADATVDGPGACPSLAAVQLEDLADMAPQDRLACFGADEVELEGRMPLSGLGGMAFGTWEPAWLAYPFSAAPLLPEGSGAPVLTVFFAPGVTPPSLPPDVRDASARVRVVGHFDDAASATCVVQAPLADAPEPAAEVELYCRTHFVATEIELVDG